MVDRWHAFSSWDQRFHSRELSLHSSDSSDHHHHSNLKFQCSVIKCQLSANSAFHIFSSFRIWYENCPLSRISIYLPSSNSYFLLCTKINQTILCYKCSDLIIYHFSSRFTIENFLWLLHALSEKKIHDSKKNCWMMRHTNSIVNSRAQHKHENWKWSRCSTPIL